MKKVSIYIINLMVLAVIASGCKKSFLEITPKGKQIAITTSDYDLLMNSSTVYLYPGTISWRAIGLMGDEIAAEKSYFSVADPTAQNAFMWSDDLYGNQGRFTDDLSFTVNIYTCNKVINEVTGSADGSTAEKTNLAAEAQAERAWIYFSLINFYGKPYQAASAGNDPGFPIIKTANISVNSFTRNNVQEVYDFIIQDLTSAIAGLPAQNAVGSTRWSKAAAEGVLGKVYLFMGKNQQALDMFNAAFTDISKNKTPRQFYMITI
jgi:tetratricopeptide (TPR) repeat protein